MDLNIRYKKRQSGKTTDLIELAEIMLSFDKKVILLVPNRAALQFLTKAFKNFFENNKNNENLIVSSYDHSMNFLRGHSFDVLLVDEISLINKNDILNIAKQNNVAVYATDTLN